MRPRSYAEVSRHLMTHWHPLRAMAVDEVSRADLAAEFRQIAKKGVTLASLCRGSLSAFISWSIAEGICESNPAIGTRRPGDMKPRDRVLIDRELAAIWNGTDRDDCSAILRLLTLTGQPRQEIAGLRWSEIDFDAKLIRLPAERTKNGRRRNTAKPACAGNPQKPCATWQ